MVSAHDALPHRHEQKPLKKASLQKECIAKNCRLGCRLAKISPSQLKIIIRSEKFRSSLFFIPFLQTGVCIWTFLTAINFKLIPARMRPIYVGVCGFFWFTFLAYLKSTNSEWQSPVLRLINYLTLKHKESLVIQED